MVYGGASTQSEKVSRFTQTSSLNPPLNEEILAVCNVSRRFKQTQALDNVSFRVYRGEIFALLGPNGAGKTTLAKMLLGTVKADSGEITFFRRGRAVDQILPGEMGYFPNDNTAYRSLPLKRVLCHTATRRGLSPEEAQNATDHWLARLDMESQADISLVNLSRGNQQKAQLAEAVIHSPALLFLDEPFASLDPLNQEVFVTTIRELQATGMTILISDHHLSLVERLADRFCILNQGRIVVSGTLDDLRKYSRTGFQIRLRLENPTNLGLLYKNPAIRQVERMARGEVRILTREDAVPSEILDYARSQLNLREALSEPVSLHDLYVRAIQSDAAPA